MTFKNFAGSVRACRLQALILDAMNQGLMASSVRCARAKSTDKALARLQALTLDAMRP